MKKRSSVRKSVKEANKKFRRLNQGVPRNKSRNAATVRMMKSFNQFVMKQALEGRLVSHEEAGLPSVVGFNYELEEEKDENISKEIQTDGTQSEV